MESAEFQEPDEARPAKRVRLEAPLAMTEEVQDEIGDNDDWDEIYGLAGDEPVVSKAVAAAEDALDSVQRLEEPTSFTDSATASTNITTPQQSEAIMFDGLAQETISDGHIDGGVPIDTTNHEDRINLHTEDGVLGDEPTASTSKDSLSIQSDQLYPGEENGVPSYEQSERENSHSFATNRTQAVADNEPATEEPGAAVVMSAAKDDITQPTSKPIEDAEFLAAAAAQKDNTEAEWQFNSSDAESSGSSSDSSSDSDSDEAESGSEDGYEMLDPATAAKILMSGDGDDDDGKSKDKSTGDRQPRTANEIKEEVVAKPDIVVTPEMKITYLGTVDRVVDNQLLIKAVTPGEYQVLEYGSILCTEDRQIVGAVADTFGRVQEPLYSVAFTNAKEIEDAGYAHGSEIFYVDSHSSFVFTQPLKNLKGTDASNIHDEEVGEDEIEFSDDEKEAEYKRLKKAAKREGRGGLSRGAFMEERSRADFGDKRRPFSGGSDVPQQQYGGGMSYDDVDAQEEFYKPLKRPDNLSQLMANGGPPRPQHGYVDRGRGRGRGDRGRGRGDRGRGRGGFESRNQRGGRGGYNQARGANGQQNGHRGNAHSFPDRHNDHRMSSSPPRQHSLPSKPHPPPQVSPAPQQQYPASQSYPNPQSYQFNGYTFQFGNPPPQPPPLQVQTGHYSQQQPAHSPTASLPAGAYVNPAFFQGQQQWAQSPQQQQQQQSPTYASWQQQPPQNLQAHYATSPSQGSSQGAANVQQQHYQHQNPQQNTNLADILKQLGGP